MLLCMSNGRDTFGDAYLSLFVHLARGTTFVKNVLLICRVSLSEEEFLSDLVSWKFKLSRNLNVDSSFSFLKVS